jgi:hypothetical protein
MYADDIDATKLITPQEKETTEVAPLELHLGRHHFRLKTIIVVFRICYLPHISMTRVDLTGRLWAQLLGSHATTNLYEVN